jgi:hypothetical protein
MDGRPTLWVPSSGFAGPIGQTHARAVLTPSFDPGEGAQALQRGAAAVLKSSMTSTTSLRRSNAFSDAQPSDRDAPAPALALGIGRVDTGCMRRLRLVSVLRVS